jgi:hypothetical protein
MTLALLNYYSHIVIIIYVFDIEIQKYRLLALNLNFLGPRSMDLQNQVRDLVANCDRDSSVVGKLHTVCT